MQVIETQDGNHHLEKQKKLDNRTKRVNKAGQLKKTLEKNKLQVEGTSRQAGVLLHICCRLCGSPAVNCSCLFICICICIWTYLKFLFVSRLGRWQDATPPGGRCRHFSQTGSELLRDSLISSDFRVSSGNYRSYSVGSKYTHTQIRTHRYKQEWATHLHNVSCHLEPLCRW